MRQLATITAIVALSLFCRSAHAAGLKIDCKAEKVAVAQYTEGHDFSWLREKARNGNAVAQYYLGMAHYCGLPGHFMGQVAIETNYAEAEKWLFLSAKQGNSNAQNALGLGCIFAYASPPTHYISEYVWFSLAAAQGNQSARSNLRELASRMTPAQVATARDLIASWKPKEPCVGDDKVVNLSHS